MQQNEDDAVLVITYLLEDGRRAFRCCASLSPVYIKLYEKLYQSSYKCIHENFPWDYWVFENPEDEKTFLEALDWMLIYEDANGYHLIPEERSSVL